MATATQRELNHPSNPWTSGARLYEVSEPVAFDNSEDGLATLLYGFPASGETNYIVVSAVPEGSTGAPETAVFPVNEDGLPLSFIALDTRYEENYEAALSALGVTVVSQDVA